MRKLPGQNAAIPTLLQCKFAYIPILGTLKSLFKNQHFQRTYLDYNQLGGNGHKCSSDTYVDFCCGQIYRKSILFQSHPHSLQIQLYQDDFEVCVPIGSKATIHKICGVYFAIRNWPNSSKLSHIYLVALCNTDDLKTSLTDFNNIWRRVREDIEILETEGLQINEHLILRGSLTNVCADNAGANSSLGFAESFSANYFCRICELSKKACQSSCIEQRDELRTIQKYDTCLEVLKNLTKVDYIQTKGIRMKCSLNALDNFHVVENYCIDLMHDLAEGVIPFLLRCIFNYCINRKIIASSKLSTKIQFFNYYGKLNKKNVPSVMMIEKHNLNQNASQSMCLFRHIPFILNAYKHQLDAIWDSMISLQKIVQIVHSRKLFENDLIVLNEAVENHLHSIIRNFGARLLPKHHNLTHYSTVIRAIGPLQNHTTIRFEAKHQVFKQFAKNNKNFRDLNYTLALKHQNRAHESIKNFENIKKISASGNRVFRGNLNLQNNYGLLYEKKFVLIDSRRFEMGLMILHDSFLYEIVHVLESCIGYLMLCARYEFLEYNSFLHSFEVQRCEPEEECFLEYKTFEDYSTFEKKFINNKIYVQAQNLDIERSFQCRHK